MSSKAKILIVDDDRVVLRLMEKNKLLADYDLVLSSTGKEAHDALNDFIPDLFILDFLLPDCTGADICRTIKGQEQFKNTPVIFMTSLDRTDKLLEAFEVGAVDYVVKPVVMQELATRVKTQLELYFARKELAKFATQMEQLAEARARQLVHADRLATLGTLSAGVAHEIKNPATFISGNIQTLERFWAVMGPVLQKEATTDPSLSDLAFVLSEMPSLLEGIKDGVARIRRVSDNLGKFSRKGGDEKKKIPLARCVEDALCLCEKILKNGVRVERRMDEHLTVIGDDQQLGQVFVNLIVNAADALQGTKDGLLSFEVFRHDGRVHVIVNDNGPGIAEENLSVIWDPFFTTKPVGKGTGLGLSISRSIVEEHGGTIVGRNRQGGGMQFEITFPLAKE